MVPIAQWGGSYWVGALLVDFSDSGFWGGFRWFPSLFVVAPILLRGPVRLTLGAFLLEFLSPGIAHLMKISGSKHVVSC